MTPPRKEPDLAERYEVLETLEESAVQVLQRCRDRTLGREVLLKRPGTAPELFSDSPAEDARALREARSLAQVAHPHIQRILDAFESPEGLILVLEPTIGETLAERLERDGPLHPDEVRTLGVQLADALAAVHAIGAVHRDLSTRNVALRPDGSACLTGFRLAKFNPQIATISTIAEALALEELKGGDTPESLLDYPAPEQFAGERASARTDLFGLGCVLYRALTGTEAIPELLGSGWSQPTDPARLRPETPRSLAKAILGCLPSNPMRRVQTAAELRDTLRTVAPGARARRPWLVPTVVAGVLVLAGLAYGIGQLLPPTTTAAGPRGIREVDPTNPTPYTATIGTSYALLIGIGEAYQLNGFDPLPNAVRDVEAMAAALEALPRDWDVTLLTEERATRRGILDAKAALEHKLAPDDRVLVYYAGHGMAHEHADQSGWILPADGRSLADDPGRASWIRYDEFKHFFDEATAKHLLVLMDCCYSGRLARERSSSGAQPYEERYLTRKAHVLITSGAGDERVLDGEAGKNSPFATAILEALDGCPQPALTSSMLYAEILKSFGERRIPHEPEQYHPDPDERGQFVFFLE